MRRKAVPLLFAAGAMAIAQIAEAQLYNCNVLYPLTSPSGVQNAGAQYMSPSGEAAGYGYGTSNQGEGVVWSTSGGVTLPPSTFTSSYAFGVGGNQAVGSGTNRQSVEVGSALLWDGLANSPVNLNPTNLNESIYISAATATNGTQQVGWGSYNATNSFFTHALLWNGTASSAVDLNPTNLPGYTISQALGTDGTNQVGYGAGTVATGDVQNPYALLWNNTAASAVNLNPAGYSSSYAYAVSGNEEVGYAWEGIDNAMVWMGNAQSAVDLNPTLPGVATSIAYGTNGIEQVGVGWNFNSNAKSQALVWDGTAASAVDLNPFLPSAGSWGSATAYSVDSNGNIYGIVGGTFDGVTNNFAVEWSPVPEPTSVSLLLIGSTGMLMRRRRRPL
jgi:hypothetical protein